MGGLFIASYLSNGVDGLAWARVPEPLAGLTRCWGVKAANPNGVRWRFALRRLLYGFARPDGPSPAADIFFDTFLRSPKLRDFDRWQSKQLRALAASHRGITPQGAVGVACIDPFVDKNLLCGSEPQDQRKIVGFASGLGDYGELNLTVSTEQDTLKRLAELVRGQLDGLLPFQQSPNLEAMAVRVVDEAEAIIGLSSLHAVVGEGEKIREVVGFAAILRALAKPVADMSQLLPIDALGHWFADSEVTCRPDLLRVSLTVRENAPPLIQAVVIECKFAQHNPAHLLKATQQVRDGLNHLTQLFAPNRPDITRMGFDRRYWWAQLQRAITSRSLVNLADAQRRKLDQALESVADGYYEITWQGAIFTFWTDEPGPTPVVMPLALPVNALAAPFFMSAFADFRCVGVGENLWHSMPVGGNGGARLTFADY